MEARQSYDEARNEQLITATRSHFSILTRAVINGDQAATKRVVDALGDYLADDQAAALLICTTLQAGDSLLPILTNLIWDEARELAEADVKQMELHRAESRDDNRIAIVECDRLVALAA
jgi:hypothetical protein